MVSSLLKPLQKVLLYQQKGRSQLQKPPLPSSFRNREPYFKTQWSGLLSVVGSFPIVVK